MSPPLLFQVMEKHEKLFLETFAGEAPELVFAVEESEILASIAKNHLLDLTTNLSGYFDDTLREEISRLAAQKLASAVKENNSHLTFEIWQKVVVDYHRNGYWGTQRLATPPPPSPESENSPTREMFKYIWVFVQAGILMKAVVLYFGLNAANESASNDSLFLYLALAFSFLSMGFFAWRLHRKENKK